MEKQCDYVSEYKGIYVACQKTKGHKGKHEGCRNTSAKWIKEKDIKRER